MAGLESLLKGRELAGRYRIEEVIGRGGMGAVYRATDQRLGRPVAVKVITASAGNDPEVRERLRARFRHEAASAARLPHHPNVVPVYDYGTDEELGLDYIVMELLRGQDLASRLQRGGVPPMAEALRVLQHAARGVAVGHRAGLIHRDVKPGNVFLVEQGAGDDMQVRVLDFGIAKAMAEEDTASAGLTHDGRAPLSPAYASPEQLVGEARLTPASDVFSLGALGFQLLTGTRPFTDADRNRMGAGMQVPVPALRARNPQVPEEVEQVIRRALEPDPAQRYPDATALADALSSPLRRIADTPLAAAVPATAAGGVVDDDRTMLADADRTAFAGDDDRTMLAPPPVRGTPAPAARPAATPVINPPRRRQAEPRTGIHPMVWVLLLAVAGLAGWLVWQQMNRGPSVGPVAADTAVVDTAKQDTIDGTDALALSMEGLRFLNAGDPAVALTFFQRAVAVDDRNPEYRDQMAVALIRLGRHEDAAELLESTIRIDRRYDLLYSHLAEARLAMGDTVSAVRALDEFVEVTQNQEDRRRAVRMLEVLRPATAAPPIQPVPGPAGQGGISPPPVIETDTFAPPPRPAPRDSIRIGTPR
ncbi:MAG TPA: serine/threonine-protein kinase [Longimicrobium sp.]|jgi:serine/threonine-protein kinase|uniref:serine/threonine-protein kinase n=1 Tax=Longimicrobium sp. TaxID=2029185 RepID=UPI002ED87216